MNIKYTDYIKTFFELVAQSCKAEDLETAKQAGICEYCEQFANAYPSLKNLALELNCLHGRDISLPQNEPQGIYEKSGAFFELYQSIKQVLEKNASYQNAKDISTEGTKGYLELFRGLKKADGEIRKKSSEAFLINILKFQVRKNLLEERQRFDDFWSDIKNSDIARNLIPLIRQPDVQNGKDSVQTIVNNTLYDSLMKYLSTRKGVSEEIVCLKASKALAKRFGQQDINIGNEAAGQIYGLIKKYRNMHQLRQNQNKEIYKILIQLKQDVPPERISALILQESAKKDINAFSPVAAPKNRNKIIKANVKNIGDVFYWDEQEEKLPKNFKRHFNRLVKFWVNAEIDSIYTILNRLDKYLASGAEGLENSPMDKTVILEGFSSLVASSEAAEKYLEIPLNKVQIRQSHIDAMGRQMDEDDAELLSYLKFSYEEQYDLYADSFEKPGKAPVSGNFASLLEALPQSLEKYRVSRYSSMALNSIYQSLQRSETSYRANAIDGILAEVPDWQNDSYEFMKGKFGATLLSDQLSSEMNKHIVEVYILPMYEGEKVGDDEFFMLKMMMHKNKLSKEDNDFLFGLAKYQTQKAMEFFEKKLQDESIPEDIGNNLCDMEDIQGMILAVSKQLDKVEGIYAKQKKYYLGGEKQQAKEFPDFILQKGISRQN